MRLSAKKVQYACAALFELALEHRTGQPVQVHTIADRQKLPTNYLVQILITLRRAGLVSSVRGSQGGYRLATAPEQITLAEVIRIVDGPLCQAPSGPLPDDHRLASFWLEKVQREACESIERDMQAISIADIVDRYGEQQQPMYYI